MSSASVDIPGQKLSRLTAVDTELALLTLAALSAIDLAEVTLSMLNRGWCSDMRMYGAVEHVKVCARF